ncbi:Uncharacterised protein [Gallibacterium anatis]|uniref:Lipoprotein n=1 Tax=Gallibacterium anatis TaxID=750 RepID=A0A377H9E8_9PAST|nr:hypothetical protein [Gallibacterium anatis]KGQ56852.1 hypothetical protein IE01_05785 [Gallibacterium anatis DSM 16844 = F 149]STO39195.1 Uncharacterised protein [Gallibacterium anatis]
MKQLKNFLLIALFSLFLAACGDKTADMKADVDLLQQTLNTVLKQESGSALIQQLEAAQTAEDKTKAYAAIIDHFKMVVKSISELKIKTEEAKKVQAQYDAGLKSFIDLMQQSSDYVTQQPTPEQIKAYTELQAKTTQSVADAEKALADLKAQIETTQKK